MNRKVFSWALYDFANTIFSMNVVSRYFPLMAVNFWGGSDLLVGVSRSVAMILTALTMPRLGAVADQRNNRRVPLVLFTIGVCLLTLIIGHADDLLVALVSFCLAVYFYEAALVFYNALLPVVALPSQIGYVSGLGVAFGYVGSITGLMVVSLLRSFGGGPFLWTAVLFFVFSLPTFFYVRDPQTSSDSANSRSHGTYPKGLRASLKRAKAIPGVIRLLVGRFFVVEAMETVILFMAVFLVNAARFSDEPGGQLPVDEVTVYLVGVTFCTVVGSYFWGIFTQRYGARTMLLWSVAVWLVALAGITLSVNKVAMFIWGALAGIGLGGFWTAERPLLIDLVKDDTKLGEFFGLYALSGRLAAVVGPLIWGAVVSWGTPFGEARYRLAVAALLVMMMTGMLILRRLPR